MNIKNSDHRQILSQEISRLIDRTTLENFENDHRTHLGASQIGEKCKRKLWYIFRWVKKSKFPANVARLFSRGHDEEFKIIKLLKLAGFTFDTQMSGDQHKISTNSNGHFGGSIDSIGYFPTGFSPYGDKIIFEFKTANDSQFKQVQKHGVKKHFPKYFSQICVYGYKMQIDYCLFVCVNKNDDNLYFEIVEVDHEHGKKMIRKADEIIISNQPPEKISLQPAYSECKFCNFKDICHFNAPTEKNCRSCIYSQAVQDKKWHCSDCNMEIPENVIHQGCDKWKGFE